MSEVGIKAPMTEGFSKQQFYSLLVKQLADDGHQELAASLSQTYSIAAAGVERNFLFTAAQAYSPMLNTQYVQDLNLRRELSSVLSSGDDVLRMIRYEPTSFSSTHKDGARAAAFSRDGGLAASGGDDGSLCVMNVDRMKRFSSSVIRREKDLRLVLGKGEMDALTGEEREQAIQLLETRDGSRRGRRSEALEEEKPVVRKYFDHKDAVNELDFHPFEPVVASCAKDSTVHFYNHSSSSRRPLHIYRDREQSSVRSLHFHPTGDWLLTCTDSSPLLRCIDVRTMKTWVSSDEQNLHKKSPNCVRWSGRGDRSIASG